RPEGAMILPDARGCKLTATLVGPCRDTPGHGVSGSRWQRMDIARTSDRVEKARMQRKAGPMRRQVRCAKWRACERSPVRRARKRTRERPYERVGLEWPRPEARQAPRERKDGKGRRPRPVEAGTRPRRAPARREEGGTPPWRSASRL